MTAPDGSTYFAPAARAGEEELAAQVARVTGSGVVGGVLGSVGGMIAVLNGQRQVLAVNHRLLEELGVGDPGGLLGLRPGEILGCVHAPRAPSGCGTGRMCASCGAAIAIVAALGQQGPAERDCALTLEHGGRLLELVLRVRAAPLPVEGERFLLLFLQDTTAAARRASLERVFFHDVKNTLTGLLGMAELLALASTGEAAELANDVRDCAVRVAREVEVQRLLAGGVGHLALRPAEVGFAPLAEGLRRAFASHPAAARRGLRLRAPTPSRTVLTDRLLVERVLENMLLNAFEATPEGGEVELGAREEGEGLAFEVWNAGALPEEARRRVFQRHFSTKAGPGRGFGTYSMKLFGETWLGGQVRFRSSAEEGTTFALVLPRRPPSSG